jgi:integrase
MFLIGCYTGLRFTDFITINRNDISGDRIKIQAHKTKQKQTIPIHPIVKQIFDKYEFMLPPPISNQKFNEYLKEIAELAGINEPFTTTMTKGGKIHSVTEPKYKFVCTHAARRSFASNAYLRGIDSIVIMAITGHKTETEFLKYVRVSQDEQSDRFKQQHGGY